MSGQALEVRYYKHQLDLLSHDKERLKKSGGNASELENLRKQLSLIQAKMVQIVETTSFVKELRIVTSPECGGLAVDMRISQHDTFASLKFAVAHLVNQSRRWSAHICFDDLVVDCEEKEPLEDDFLVAEWGSAVLQLRLARVGRRIVLVWSETKGPQPPDRDYLLAQLELYLMRHQERATSRPLKEPLRVRTATVTSAPSSSLLSAFAASFSPRSSSTLGLSTSSTASSSLISSSSSSSSPCSSPRSMSLAPLAPPPFALPVPSVLVPSSPPKDSPELTDATGEERLVEWESLVQCLLLPFVSAPSSVAQCKAKLKKVLQKLEASNAALSECILVEFRMGSLVEESPRLRMLGREAENWLLAIEWQAPSFIIGLQIKGKKLGVSFGLHVQLSGMRLKGSVRLRVPPYQPEQRALQFASEPSIDFSVESSATVGGATLPFRQAIENALMSQILKAVHKQIRKRMMGQQWVSLFQVKKELSAALSQWSVHAKAFKFDGSDDVELMTEALESTTAARKLLLATTEAMEAHMDQIKAHLRHRETLACTASSNSISPLNNTAAPSAVVASGKSLTTKGKSMFLNVFDSSRDRSSTVIVPSLPLREETKGSETSETLTGQLGSLSIAQTLPRPSSTDPVPPLPPRPNRAMTLR